MSSTQQPTTSDGGGDGGGGSGGSSGGGGAARSSSVESKLSLVFLAYDGIWNPYLWKLWNTGSGSTIKAYVHCEYARQQKTPIKADCAQMFEYVRPHRQIDTRPIAADRQKHKPRNGRSPVLLQAMGEALALALRQSPDSTHYALLPGDSVPVQPVQSWLAYLKPDTSVIAMDTGKGLLAEHNADMILCKRHAQKALKAIRKQGSQLVKEHMDKMPDEWFIGSLFPRDEYTTRSVCGWIAKANTKTLSACTFSDTMKFGPRTEYLVPNPMNAGQHLAMRRGYFQKSTNVEQWFMRHLTDASTPVPLSDFLCIRRLEPLANSPRLYKLYRKFLYDQVLRGLGVDPAESVEVGAAAGAAGAEGAEGGGGGAKASVDTK
ncbi:hypothetical protein OAM67_00035 [bacterium]|nr:hypothetical protein [bacterium]